ncbi:MAG: SurA N-terminal domain-containing protein [Candidatus Paceibacterota bacterium]
MKNLITVLVVIIILGAGGWYLYSQQTKKSGEEANANETIVATVNGEEISRDDFNALRAQVIAGQGIDTESMTEQESEEFDTQLVDTLISQRLLQQAVSDSGIIITESQIDEQVNVIKGQFESEQAFNETLSSQGATLADLREQVRSELASQAYFNQELDISSLSASDEEIQVAYDEATAGQENAPSLEEVREQALQFVLQQKQQQLINELMQVLRSNAEIEIFI